MPCLTFPPLDRRPGTRPPTCPDCGAAWQRGALHACPPPKPGGWWDRVRLWHSPPVARFVVFDDEAPQPQPMPHPPRVVVRVVKDP